MGPAFGRMSFQLQFRRYRLPFRVPVRTAHGTWAEREGVIVRLADEGGSVLGYGEAAVLPSFGTETVDEAEAACRKLGEKVDEAALAAVPANLRSLRHALASARADVAPCPTRQSALAVAALLPAGRTVVPTIAPKAEMGFRVFKWKVGVGDLADELALFDDVCAALPSGAKLRLDANGGWDRKQAERWLERCAERPVEFLEQPCFSPSAAGETARRRTDDLLRGLAGDWPTPIALDESISSEADIEHWMGSGWRGVFVVKPSLLGDVAGALRRLEAARAPVVFSSALETGVGARLALRAAFSWGGEQRALGFGVWPLFADSRFDGPIAAPFIPAEDVERLDPEKLWNALP